MELELEKDGAQRFSQILSSENLKTLLEILPVASRPGERIFGNRQLADWLIHGPVGCIAAERLGAAFQSVRAILFDKTAEENWALAWHQDRTIAVKQRVDTAGFAHWNRKAGACHVEPPFDLIERMLTARVHLDPVAEDNAPLMIAPGSHLLGRIEERFIDSVVAQCGTHACLAEPGDVWLYRTAILHASHRSTLEGRRRVLQVDFAAEDLPGNLDWLGVG